MEEKQNKSKEIPEHHSPLRHILAKALGRAYQPMHNLAEAKSVDGAHLIMEGDWGGQIYLVCPVKLVKCAEEELWQLLSELDKIIWKCNDGDGTGIYYEQRKPGEGIPGGMGGGLVSEELWIHPELVSKGLDGLIRKVITGVQHR
jgi:hypothetical protein